MKKTTLATLILAAIASPAMAYDAGDIIVRAGLTTVTPNDDSSNVNVDALGGNVGMGAEVDSNTQLGLNFVYMFDSNWGVEVLAATPFSHDVELTGTADNALALGDGQLADVKHLPPTVSAVYFFDTDSAATPYVGLGLNYTIFFDEDFTDAREEQTFSDLDLDNSFGLAAQVGVDYQLDEKWLLNASIRYIDIDTTAEFTVADVPGSVDVDIDPWVYTLSVGYVF
ncbi:OmpW family outer membrane protein [Alteromonas sp. C1M14]|uniref:OmpW family outer membrane protein n=1 Tax=Alteromonas sp. C1M14 TaxID=2841567 RepID=UPI001C084E4D|nr:OmpW family outer membrane protein [Alteromonas sp. C1M14]MBU2978472.1 outer membrane beta-barrel protein [Alteromonas sp. C1M14]